MSLYQFGWTDIKEWCLYL